MKLIAIEPHIRAGAGDGIFLLFRVVGRRAGVEDLADIGLAFKQAEGFGLGESWDDW